ncbi:MAG TPA: flagellar biosynthetic protein FliO [Dissulfurispiraceae bacterium]|nr:flagellar biosynthetic protein FliO [Dissulfurispiraceae bacterium]
MDFGFEMLKAMLALLFVLGLLVLVLKLVKGRILPQKGLIDLLHYQPLGPKRGLAIVHVAGEYLLLGMGDQGVTLLTKLQGDEIKAAIAEQKKPEPAGSQTIDERLRSLFGGRRS